MKVEPEPSSWMERDKAFIWDYPYVEKRIMEMMKRGESIAKIIRELLKYVEEG